MKRVFPLLPLLLFAACNAGAAGNVAGTYTLDTKALVAQMAPKGKAVDDAMVAKMAESMKATLVLAADGTMQMKGMFAADKQDAKGTWKLDGDKITMTSNDDSKKTMSGKVENGTITVEMPDPAGGAAHHMIFRKG